MEKGLRNTLIGITVTIAMAFCAAWIQLNSRIAVLEVQVQNDREMFERGQSENKQNIQEIKVMLQQIQMGVAHLQDVKQDKEQ